MNKFIIYMVFFGVATNTINSQALTSYQKDKIIAEINILFEKSIKAGESLDIAGITENVNDTLKAGFIDNGLYYNAFDTLMNRFKEGVKGLSLQKLNCTEKKISILSDNVVLLTASGNYSATIKDGRIIGGRFAWTFVYLKIKDNWEIVHSHMSNPR